MLIVYFYISLLTSDSYAKPYLNITIFITLPKSIPTNKGMVVYFILVLQYIY